MSYTLCHFCGEEYPKRRLDLGYVSCLDCGQKFAEKEKAFKAKCTAPAYNKGPFMFITSKECVVSIFKTGENKQFPSKFRGVCHA